MIDIKKSKEEFEQLIYDDEKFKECWADKNGNYKEEDFEEWLGGVIEEDKENFMDFAYERNIDFEHILDFMVDYSNGESFEENLKDLKESLNDN